METLQSDNTIEEIREVYGFEMAVAEISLEDSLRFGRELKERQYRILGANVLLNRPEASVDDLLWDIDYSHKYHRGLADNPDRLIGPYYQKNGDYELILPGIAVWAPSENK